MADPHTIQVLRPSGAVLRLLQEAIDAHISAYVRAGGGRHFPTEDAQDSAKLWLRSVAVTLEADRG